MPKLSDLATLFYRTPDRQWHLSVPGRAFYGTQREVLTDFFTSVKWFLENHQARAYFTCADGRTVLIAYCSVYGWHYDVYRAGQDHISRCTISDDRRPWSDFRDYVKGIAEIWEV